MSSIEQMTHGFVPGITEKDFRAIARPLIRLIRLDGRSRFSNIFIQMLDPVSEVKWTEQKSFTFRIGQVRQH